MNAVTPSGDIGRVNDPRPDHMRHYMSGDSAAFMEGFADACALLLHYSHRDALLDTIQRTGGLIYKSVIRPGAEPISDAAQIQEELGENNPFITLAPSFGEAIGRGQGLRSALSKANPSAIEEVTEPHARGQILLAAIFDAFFSIYVHRSQDLFRIYRAGGGKVDSIDLPYVWPRVWLMKRTRLPHACSTCASARSTTVPRWASSSVISFAPVSRRTTNVIPWMAGVYGRH